MALLQMGLLTPSVLKERSKVFVSFSSLWERGPFQNELKFESTFRFALRYSSRIRLPMR
jgi:hypothetical protein